MGINSTEVAYGFGQMGSAFTDDTTSAIQAPQGLVIVAITFLADAALAQLVAETKSQPAYGTSHAQRGTPEFFGSAVAAHNLGDCVIAGASKAGAITTVTHTANTAGPNSASAIQTGMQLVSLTDADFPRDGLLGAPVIVEEILSTTTFRVSSNAKTMTLSSQSLAGLALNSSGYGGVATDATQIFPKGVTIYGRWVVAEINATDTDGGMICYFGH
jgi:hypothetical protein